MGRITYALCLLMLLTVAGVGCGDSGDSTGATPTDGRSTESTSTSGEETDSQAEGPKRGVVFAASSAELGIVLFDEGGYTLYTFDKDKGTTPTCYGACAKAWPPFITAGKPRVVDASAAKTGTVKRRGGGTQVTYAGHPLYFFTGDKSPGQTKGNDVKAFGGEWYAIRPNGQKP